MKIGLFGGSFNPIHNGHISLARQLLMLASLDEVWLMVSPQNPLKQGSTELLDDQLRFEIARKALMEKNSNVENCASLKPRIVASDYELHLEHTATAEERPSGRHLYIINRWRQLAELPSVVSCRRYLERIPHCGLPPPWQQYRPHHTTRKRHRCRHHAARHFKHLNPSAGKSWRRNKGIGTRLYHRRGEAIL
jgi:cytidyltransferase-like protein